MSGKKQCCSDLAVRAARAEIERDAAMRRADELGDLLHALYMKNEEQLLDTLTVIGIPARDLKDIYSTVEEYHRINGGKAA